MQNYGLLEVVGKLDKPVLLKRGLSSTLDELLQAADYILKEGNERVMLCERGIRTFDNAMRFTLDLGAVPWLKLHTHLPVIVDPSHASGDRRLVGPLSRAAAAVGADGIIVEVAEDPEVALCDGPQQLYAADFAEFAARRGGAREAGGTHRVTEALTPMSVCLVTLPPGPRAPRALQTARWIARPAAFMEDAQRRYGDMFTLKIANEGTWVFISDPDAVKQVFTGDPRLLHAGEANIVLLPVLGSHSVLLLDDDAHMAQRKLMLPPFHGERMRGYERDDGARWPRARSSAGRRASRWRRGRRCRRSRSR